MSHDQRIAQRRFSRALEEGRILGTGGRQQGAGATQRIDQHDIDQTANLFHPVDLGSLGHDATKCVDRCRVEQVGRASRRSIVADRGGLNHQHAVVVVGTEIAKHLLEPSEVGIVGAKHAARYIVEFQPRIAHDRGQGQDDQRAGQE